jgi:hypothetical protein
MWALLNHTPYAAARTWVQDPDGAKRWVVVVKGTFTVHADGGVSLADEQVPPLLLPEYNGEDEASSVRYEADLVPPKPGTDVIVNGHAYAPGGRPATRVVVALGVGQRRKILEVHGDRTWQRDILGDVPSPPLPFVRMPLVYERAYGGHDRRSPVPARQRMFAPNPVGTGHVARRARRLGRPVPNVEHPGKSLEYGAAGFGVIASHWSPRCELAGTYDARWVQQRKPLPPEDFDPRFHMCAPVDQQFVPHLRGGDPIELVNLTSDGVLRFTLPKVYLAFRTRIAARRSERHAEHRAKLHTVVIEPDHPRVLMVWHTSLLCHHEADYLESTTIHEKPYVSMEARPWGDVA